MDKDEKKHNRIIILVGVCFFCVLCFGSAVVMGSLVYSSQATASSKDEVQPKKASDDTRDKSLYKTVGHYYTDAAQYESEGGAWGDFITGIETAMMDDTLSNDEYSQIQSQYLLLKEAQARQLLMDDIVQETDEPTAELASVKNVSPTSTPYQQVLAAKIAVEAMPPDPINIFFIDKIDTSMADSVLSEDEYKDIIQSYNEIRATEDKTALLNLVKQSK